MGLLCLVLAPSRDPGIKLLSSTGGLYSVLSELKTPARPGKADSAYLNDAWCSNVVKLCWVLSWRKKKVSSSVLTLCSKMTNECHGHSCASSCFPYIFLFFPLFSSSVSVCVRVVGIASFLTPSSAPLHTCLQSADYRSRSAHLAVISVSHCSISNCSSVHIQSQNIASATAVVTCFRPLYRSVIISSCWIFRLYL